MTISHLKKRAGQIPKISCVCMFFVRSEGHVNLFPFFIFKTTEFILIKFEVHTKSCYAHIIFWFVSVQYDPYLTCSSNHILLIISEMADMKCRSY
jgi:hypothetical protein